METNARGGVDAISRTHRMTLDEASQILNVKKTALVEESELQQMLKVSTSARALGVFLGGPSGDRGELIEGIEPLEHVLEGCGHSGFDAGKRPTRLQVPMVRRADPGGFPALPVHRTSTTSSRQTTR